MPLGPQKYSERLGLIEPDQLQAAADEFGLGRVIDAEPAPSGLFGQNLFLETTEGQFVLRGNPHGHVQLTKERRVAEFINDRSSLPVPWPYQVCDSDELFGWTYAVMPRLPGRDAQQLRAEADDDERIELAAAMGDALAMLHEAGAETFGPYDAQLDAFIEMDDFRDWALHRFEHWRSECRAINALSTEAELYIDDVVEACTPALDEPFRPVLVHHDFKPGNVNFDDDYEPTGVFDLMEAYIADGDEDVVRMLWSVNPDEARAFVDAYTAVNPSRPGAADRLAIYALSDWLVIWGYGKRVGNDWFGDATFVETAKPIVEFARSVATA